MYLTLKAIVPPNSSRSHNLRSTYVIGEYLVKPSTLKSITFTTIFRINYSGNRCHQVKVLGGWCWVCLRHWSDVGELNVSQKNARRISNLSSQGLLKILFIWAQETGVGAMFGDKIIGGAVIYPIFCRDRVRRVLGRGGGKRLVVRPPLVSRI